MHSRLRFLALAAIVATSGAGTGDAAAHPHVFVEAKSEVVFDGDGRAIGIRHAWRFDKFFSTYAILGYDADQNGILTTEELSELAEINAQSLKDFDYYTFPYYGKEQVEIAKISGYWLQYDPDMQQLTFYFVLEFAEPVAVDGEQTLTIDVFDPEYFVALEMVQDEPFKLVDAPAGCTLKREEAGQLDPQTAAALAAIPREGSIPEDVKPLVASLSHTAVVACG